MSTAEKPPTRSYLSKADPVEPGFIPDELDGADYEHLNHPSPVPLGLTEQHLSAVPGPRNLDVLAPAPVVPTIDASTAITASPQQPCSSGYTADSALSLDKNKDIASTLAHCTPSHTHSSNHPTQHVESSDKDNVEHRGPALAHRQLLTFSVTNLDKNTDPHDIRALHLEWNLLRSISRNTLRRFSGLRILDLRHNRLTNAGAAAIYDTVLFQLEELYLSYNNIDQIFSDTPFTPTSSGPLRVLDLAHNHLKALPPTLGSWFPKLTVLDASYNVLEALPPAIGDLFHLEVLDVTANPTFKAFPVTCGRLGRLRTLGLDWFRYCAPPLPLTVRDVTILARMRSGLNKAHAQGQKTLDCVEWLTAINSGPVDLNGKTTVGAKSPSTRLHRAAAEGHIGVAESLIQHGAALNLRDSEGLTPLFIALRSNCDPIVQLLISAKASIMSGPLGSALHVAVAKLNTAMCRYLLTECDIDVNIEDEDGNTPLHVLMSVFDVNPIAAKEIATLLLHSGALCNPVNRDKWCPVHLAARRGQDAAMQFIIHRYLNSSVQCQKGHCHHVSRSDTPSNSTTSSAVLKSTCPFTFDLDIRGGSHSWSPLHLAGHAGRPRIVQLLLNGGANVMLRNRTGRTPRQVSRGTVVTFKLLRAAEDLWLLHKTRRRPFSLLKENSKNPEATFERPHYNLASPIYNMLGIGVIPAIAVAEAAATLPSIIPAESPCGSPTSSIMSANITLPSDFETPPSAPSPIATKLPLTTSAVSVPPSPPYPENQDHSAKSHDPLLELVEFRVVPSGDAMPSTKNTPKASLVADPEEPRRTAFGPVEWEAVQRQLWISTGWFHPKATQQLAALKPLEDDEVRRLRVSASLEYLVAVATPSVRHRAPDPPPPVHDYNQLRHTALHIGLTYNIESLVLQVLASCGQDSVRMVSEFRTSEQQTALHLICQSQTGNPVDLVLRLLQLPHAGWNVNSQDTHGFAPLHCAAKAGHAEVVKLLMVNGADPNILEHTTAWTPLHLAVAYGHHNAVLMLLAHPRIDVDQEDNFGRAPLTEAVSRLDFRLIALLVNRGATLPLSGPFQQRFFTLLGYPEAAAQETLQGPNAVTEALRDALHGDNSPRSFEVSVLNANGITFEEKEAVELSDVVVHCPGHIQPAGPVTRHLSLRRPLGTVAPSVSSIGRPQRRWRKPVRRFVFPATTSAGTQCYVCFAQDERTSKSVGACRICSIPLCSDCLNTVTTYDTSFLDYRETPHTRPIAQLAAAVPLHKTPRHEQPNGPPFTWIHASPEDHPSEPSELLADSSSPNIICSPTGSTSATRTPLSDAPVGEDDISERSVHQNATKPHPSNVTASNGSPHPVPVEWIHRIIDYHCTLEELRRKNSYNTAHQRHPQNMPFSHLTPKSSAAFTARCHNSTTGYPNETVISKLAADAACSQAYGVSTNDWTLVFNIPPPFVIVNCGKAITHPQGPSRVCVNIPTHCDINVKRNPGPYRPTEATICPYCLSNFELVPVTETIQVNL